MTLPALPALPPQGSTSWYPWANGIHDVLDEVAARSLGWNVITDKQWAGGAVLGQDCSAAIQAATDAGGVVYFPPTLFGTTDSYWGAAGVTISGTQAESVRWVGAGRTVCKVRLTSGANTSIVTGNLGPLPRFEGLWFDGNKANNTAGHCINLADNTTGTYQGGADIYDCYFTDAPQDNLHVGQSRGNGRIVNCTFGQAGQDNISIDGADWIVLNTNCEDAGRRNVNLNRASGFAATNGAWYRAKGDAGVYVGFNTLHSSITQTVIDSNAQRGIWYVQSSGGTGGQFQQTPNGHHLTGCTFFRNSRGLVDEGTGLYSDIHLSGVFGIQIVGCNFTWQGVHSTPKYNIEDTSPTGSTPSRHVYVIGAQYWNAGDVAGAATRASYTTAFTNIVSPNIVRIDAVAVSGSTGAADLTLDGYGDAFTAGETSIPRRDVVTAAVGVSASGTMRLTYFRARRSETVSSVRFQGGSVAAATPTLIRVGIYSEDASGNLTLVASTANDTTLFTTTFTEYTKALSASWNKTAGARYAVGVLVLATTTPTFYGVPGSPNGGLPATEMFRGPKVSANLASQTDLPASITAGSLTNTGGGLIYTALV